MTPPRCPLTDSSASSAGELGPPESKAPRLRYWTWGLPLFAVLWLLAYFWWFADPVALAQRNWPLILVGFVGAVLGNATAVGGGLIFVPVMILVYHLGAVPALKLALASQAFGMTSGAFGWMRRGAVPFGLVRLTLLPTLAGCTFGTVVVQPSSLLVKGLFGPTSILIGISMLWLLRHSFNADDIPRQARLPTVWVAVLGGVLTAWVAIGIGEVIAAYLMLRYRLRPDRAIGLGVVLLAVSSIYLTLLHQLLAGDIPWDLAVFTILGCVFGARLGPYLSQWVSPKRLKLTFAAIAIVDGVIFLVQFLRR